GRVGTSDETMGASAAALRDAIACTGRIADPAALQGFHGTGIQVGGDLVMANRHVLQAIASQGADGSWTLKPNIAIDFGHEFRGTDTLRRRAVNRIRRDCDHRRDGLQREQKDLERRIGILLDAFASGVLKGASVQTKLEALEARQSEVAKELASLSEDPVRLHPNLAALYRRKVAALQELLESDATHTEAVEIIRSLVDQVIFRPTPEAGKLEVELVGDIAGMVHLAQNSKENSPVSGAVHDEFTRSVKVVA